MELFALQQARNELIGWIERQLALIGIAQADAETGLPTPGPDRCDGRAVSSEELESLYDDYINARQRLLRTVRSPSQSFPHANLSTSPDSKRSSPQDHSTNSAAATLLPYIAPLLAYKDSEASLIQQQTYLRRQLATAEAETERIARRLADESHLVHPGVSKGVDWAMAGVEAGAGTKKLAHARVEVGGTAAKEAEIMLESIETIPMTIEKLRDGVR
jgi:hypothetical protein